MKQVPNSMQRKFNVNTATAGTYKTWSLQATNVLTMMLLMSAITHPDDVGVSFQECQQCCQVLFLMLTADCLQMFEPFLASADARGMWNAIKRKVVRIDMLQLDGMKADVMSLTFDRTGTMTKVLEKYWDKLSGNILEIRLLDPTWYPDQSVLRRNIVKNLPHQLLPALHRMNEFPQLEDFKVYLNESALLYDATHQQRSGLANHAGGTELPTSVKVLSSTVQAGTRTVVLTRPLQGLNKEYYTFDVDATNGLIPIINAVGSTPAFGYHKNKAPAEVLLVPSSSDTGTKGAAGACICPQKPKPFGLATGSLQYHQVQNQSVDTGMGSVAFAAQKCPVFPATVLNEQRNPT